MSFCYVNILSSISWGPGYKGILSLALCYPYKDSATILPEILVNILLGSSLQLSKAIFDKLGCCATAFVSYLLCVHTQKFYANLIYCIDE